MWSSLEILFSSAARVHILRLFLLNPGRPFYQREIARESGQPIRAVQREMDRLASIGLLARSAEAHRVFYCLNPQFPLLAELTALFQKAAGSEGVGVPTVQDLAAVRQPQPAPLPAAQPFAWMETPAATTLPARLRRLQAEREWDRGY
jgi:hypothetical protein